MEAQFNKNIYYNYFVGNITMKIWGMFTRPQISKILFRISFFMNQFEKLNEIKFLMFIIYFEYQ